MYYYANFIKQDNGKFQLDISDEPVEKVYLKTISFKGTETGIVLLSEFMLEQVYNVNGQFDDIRTILLGAIKFHNLLQNI